MFLQSLVQKVSMGIFSIIVQPMDKLNCWHYCYVPQIGLQNLLEFQSQHTRVYALNDAYCNKVIRYLPNQPSKEVNYFKHRLNGQVYIDLFTVQVFASLNTFILLFKRKTPAENMLSTQKKLRFVINVFPNSFHRVPIGL